ncbi:DUF308 domain-containing protein [Alkalicoccobacillus porphyridii]|uniref:DUF308 domain-containing protein n=1 Tax=Alkalicoccobacillus porphyridii TaxID=2597270 RepID=A0A553ZZ63_9BACI|nr:DUF308 domain-containing protein [Alkalicoccobacillus porphyridii]TSB46732.1 DUF308 domain-containing protein [Alkalicoccobacillus porphyridii]
MTVKENQDQEPVRLVDPEDKSLTFLNTDVHKPEYGKREYNSGASADSFNEETANEFPAPQRMDYQETDDQEEASIDGLMKGKAMGIFALILSILSLFILPILLGAAGIVIGIVSRKGDAKTLGSWAIGIGAVSIIASLFFRSFI